MAGKDWKSRRIRSCDVLYKDDHSTVPQFFTKAFLDSMGGSSDGTHGYPSAKADKVDQDSEGVDSSRLVRSFGSYSMLTLLESCVLCVSDCVSGTAIGRLGLCGCVW